jgi:hypothetical protein
MIVRFHFERNFKFVVKINNPRIVHKRGTNKRRVDFFGCGAEKSF